MKILTVDVGTGTQDIYLYDSHLNIENGFKLVVPSPTMIIHRRIKAATRQGKAVALSGVTMGGGPSHWAAEAHLRAGLAVYATPEAARTFDDDLAAVEAMGVRVISEDEFNRLPGDVLRFELRDFDLPAVTRALAEFDVPLDDLCAVAVAVFDHGNAPPGYSDRQFRFDYLDARLQELASLGESTRQIARAFAFRSESIPPIMTRLQAVAKSHAWQTSMHPSSALGDIPLVVMDTAAAAVLGALFDQNVADQLDENGQVLIANIGNFHSLAFRLGVQSVEGVFEHHTGLIDLPELERLLNRLAQGSLQHEEVFGHHGHGALIYNPEPMPLGNGNFDVAVTGPRRGMYLHPGQAVGRSQPFLRPYFAVPFGDMMLAGCFGLLAAAGELLGEEVQGQVRRSLQGAPFGRAPWDN
jgi:uncharacterized protein (DUF1786 family)